MNKKGIIVGIVVVFLLIVGAYISIHNKKDVIIQNDIESDNKLSIEDTAVMRKKNVDTPAKEEGVMVASGSYEPYSPEKIAQKSATGNVVLFFKANWCPTCRALDKDIQENISNIPLNLTILDVNYDTANELKRKYEVTYQHTMVEVDKDGIAIKKWMGSPTLDSFLKEII